MSCGCNDVDTDNPNGNAGCGPCNPCTDSTVACESLPSALDNFTAHFFGEVAKSMVDSRVQWILPCNLETGLPDNPRTDGEGLACYFLRLFEEGIVGLTGAKGDTGIAGENGLNGYTFTAESFTVPTSECPIVQFNVEEGDVIPSGSYVFVDVAGWFSVTSRTGNLIMCQLIQATSPAGTVIPAGSFVAITGPEGPQGQTGPRGLQGEKGNKGDTGTPGSAGADGANAQTETTANYTQPVVGGTVLVNVSDSSAFTGGAGAYVVGGGYYEVAAVVPGVLTLRNVGVAATNAVATTVVASGAVVITSGVAPVVSSGSGIAIGGSNPSVTTTNAEITFGTTPLSIDLPSAGSYDVTAQVALVTGNPAPFDIKVQLYDNTNATLIGHPTYVNVGQHPSVHATATISQRVTTVGAVTVRVWAETDVNTATATSAECSMKWTRVYPVN